MNIDADGHETRFSSDKAEQEFGERFDKILSFAVDFGTRFVDAAASLASDVNQVVSDYAYNQRNSAPGSGCSCSPQQPQWQSEDSNKNNSFRQTEQGRDAQGKFLPKNGGEAAPGAAAEKEALEAVGATKNFDRIPGSNRIPDGKIADATDATKVEQYVEGKSGAYVGNTAQLREMAAAAKDATGKPLKLVTNNPNVKISSKVVDNGNIQIVRLNQK